MFRFLFKSQRLCSISLSNYRSYSKEPDKKFSYRSWILSSLAFVSASTGCYMAYETFYSTETDETLDDFPLIEYDQNVFTNPMDYVNRQMLLEGCYDNTAHAYIGYRRNLSKQFRPRKSLTYTVEGYHVYTPFVLKDGRRVLVNRGWVSKKARNDPVRVKLDEVEGPTQVVGLLVAKESGGIFDQIRMLMEVRSKWIYQNEFANVDMELLTRKFNLSLADAYFIARSDSKATSQTNPVADQIYLNENVRINSYINVAGFLIVAAILIIYQ